MARGSSADGLGARTFFYDIGDTLAVPIWDGPDLAGFSILPGVTRELEVARAAGARLGIVSYPGSRAADLAAAKRAFTACGLAEFFDAALVRWELKDSPEPFRRAATVARVPTAECLFVGENSRERAWARTAGMWVAPHPRLALDVSHGNPILYLRATPPADSASVDWSALISDLPVVPLRITAEPRVEMLAMGTAAAGDALQARGLTVTRLRAVDDPVPSDTYLIRDGAAISAGPASEGRTIDGRDRHGLAELVLADAPDGLYVALAATTPVDALHPPGAPHARSERLTPRTSGTMRSEREGNG